MLPDAKPLRGKVALITGAARRLGKASALALAQAGADVAITYLRSSRDADRTLEELRRAGVTAKTIRCDVTDPRSVRRAIKSVISEFGGLDILVNNAGNYESVDFNAITLEQWDAIFASNVRGPFLVAQTALPFLKRRYGRIINLGSLGGLRAWAKNAHYCSSKAALHMLTRVMAKALAPEVAVNCVAPGMIDLGEQSAKAFMKRMAKQTPMQRNGTAKDVSSAVVFFATAPHFITGQIVFVDGGLGL